MREFFREVWRSREENLGHIYYFFALPLAISSVIFIAYGALGVFYLVVLSGLLFYLDEATDGWVFKWWQIIFSFLRT